MSIRDIIDQVAAFPLRAHHLTERADERGLLDVAGCCCV
jgi:hypothetical protein